MPDYQLIIGNRNYSSWSLRAGLAAAASGADVEETVIPLDRPETRAAIRAHSPAGLVPVLKRGELAIWDSLAIAEYLAETFPDARLWPEDVEARAVARAVTAEMHAGFRPMRMHMPMDMSHRHPSPSPMLDGVAEDIARITAIWEDCRDRFGGGGDFLFGRFTIADAFYAPVASRFRTYGVPLNGTAAAYVEAIFAYPAMAAWAEAAAAEPWKLDVLRMT
jgi:glutathione S-transferase